MSGDVLYSLRKNPCEDYLLLKELPNYIKYNQNYFSSYIQKVFVGTMGQKINSEISCSLESFFNRAFAVHDNAILIFHSCAIAVKHNNGSFYIFDPHCRGMNGWQMYSFNSKFLSNFMPIFKATLPLPVFMYA